MNTNKQRTYSKYEVYLIMFLMFTSGLMFGYVKGQQDAMNDSIEFFIKNVIK